MIKDEILKALHKKAMALQYIHSRTLYLQTIDLIQKESAVVAAAREYLKQMDAHGSCSMIYIDNIGKALKALDGEA